MEERVRYLKETVGRGEPRQAGTDDDDVPLCVGNVVLDVLLVVVASSPVRSGM